MNIKETDTNYLVLNHRTKEKIENKTEILQFLPEQLEPLSKVNKIRYNSENLKTSYIIDILHGLIYKYYREDKNEFILNSKILRENYTKNYNSYINYLVKNRYLTLIKDYSKGNRSRVYSMNLNLLNKKTKRYVNSDKILIKKHKARLLELSFDNNNIINKEVKEKLINDLYSIDIQLDKVIFYLDNLHYNDVNIYNKNMHSSKSIEFGDIFYHFDIYGRMHTNFTTLKSFIRKNCISMDGEELIEFDIKNSQPLFLTKLMIDSNSKWINKDELDFFKKLTINGNYYDYIMNRFNIKDRKKVKKLTYKVLFGSNSLIKNDHDKKFNTCFPTIYNFITLYKKENNNYRMLSYDLQKAESNFIFNNLVKTIMNIYPEIKIVTVHDSIMVKAKYKNIIEPIFKQKLAEEFDM